MFVSTSCPVITQLGDIAHWHNVWVNVNIQPDSPRNTRALWFWTNTLANIVHFILDYFRIWNLLNLCFRNWMVPLCIDLLIYFLFFKLQPWSSHTFLIFNLHSFYSKHTFLLAESKSASLISKVHLLPFKQSENAINWQISFRYEEISSRHAEAMKDKIGITKERGYWTW